MVIAVAVSGLLLARRTRASRKMRENSTLKAQPKATG